MTVKKGKIHKLQNGTVDAYIDFKRVTGIQAAVGPEIWPHLSKTLIDAEFDLDAAGRPTAVRLLNLPATPARPAAPPPNVPPVVIVTPGLPSSQREAWRKPSPGIEAWFANPYNFVPSPAPRGTGSAFSDSAPTGHACFAADRVAARIKVRMTLETPLLLPDAARKRQVPGAPEEHFRFPTRLLNGAPLIPQTSVRGMLRSAFEAVTNSRLPFLASHDERLGLRMPPQEALGLVPAIVEDGPIAGMMQLRLLPGCNLGTPKFDNNRGRFATDSDEMYAAWLPSYAPTAGLTYPLNGRPSHSDRVYFTRVRPHPMPSAYRYWLVSTIRPAVGEMTNDEFEGHVCITNQNIAGKRHERVFYLDPQARPPADPRSALPTTIPLSDQVIRDYALLFRNSKDTNEARAERKLKRGASQDQFEGPHVADIERAAFSRHLCTGESELRPGMLVHARFDRVKTGALLGVSPVMIGRDLYLHPPSAFIDPSLQPARARDELSPADRVFGWVNQSGSGAHRAQLRIRPVQLEEGQTDVIEDFTRPAASRHHDTNGLTLAILGEPKPAQARFYAAHSRAGAPLPDGVPKRYGYSNPGTQSLRGRKVYPHHRLAAATPGYWTPPADYRAAAVTPLPNDGPAATYREYLRPMPPNSSPRDKQNRAIESWVKPTTRFTFEIRASNLSKAELGALIWLLTLPPGHFHRLGGGKPLGFGSVRLELMKEESAVLDHQAIADRYATPFGRADAQAWAAPLAEQAVAAFKGAAGNIAGRGAFDELPTIRAFLNAAEGPAWPVHYPRVLPPLAAHGATASGPAIPPDEKGESFRWFTENDGHIAIEDATGHVKLEPRRDGTWRDVKGTAPGYALPAGWKRSRQPESKDGLLPAYRRPGSGGRGGGG